MDRQQGRGRAARARPGGSNRIRVIAGRYRGRRLRFPDRPGLRPTADRLRETLFNWLAADLPGSRCLDAFAGSGALGIEALSRGAAQVVFLERDGAAAAALAANLSLLGAEGGRVVRDDALRWLAHTDEPFQIAFLDPPFAGQLLERVLDLLAARRLVVPGGWVYLESPARASPALPPSWRLHRQAQVGAAVGRLVQVGG
ncbi:MAG: ribosomal RNA small subunit methyltransferase D [Porticoccaceae bacterium]|nr:MAG: ribosomal RNA small subunit methyltransferase D [Porticoccaceae bacterium]